VDISQNFDIFRIVKLNKRGLQMAKFVGEANNVKNVLKTHLKAVATKDIALLRQSFAQKAIFIGSDDTERWSLHGLAKRLEESKNGWDMQKCLHRDVQHFLPDVATFFEVIRHVKYGLFRGSGTVIRNKKGSWVITHYVLSFSVPNEVVDKTNILELLKSS
jgi:hypothetical protein